MLRRIVKIGITLKGVGVGEVAHRDEEAGKK
jgi:hypothetical protein